MRLHAVAVAAATALLASTAPAGAASQTDNVRVVDTFAVDSANEIAFDGRRVYVGGFGGADHGINVFEIRGGKVTKTAEIPCGFHADVAALPGKAIAASFQGHGVACSDSGTLPTPTTVGGLQGGVQVIDAKNPLRPRYLGSIEIPGGVHTLTRHPKGPFVYTSAGGADAYAARGGYTNVVDVSDGDAPKVVTKYQSPLNPAGCHDIVFEDVRGELVGFCPGQGGTELWDASDPKAPVSIGRIEVPFGQLPHVVAVSPDDELLAIGDEAYAGHACGAGTPAGAIWIYDISDLTDPQLEGFVSPPRGGTPAGVGSGNDQSCTAHNFNFIPGSRNLVTTWISGGTSVVDLTDPAAPKEIAHYSPDDAVAMSSYWYRGLVFVSDFRRGVEVLELDLKS